MQPGLEDALIIEIDDGKISIVVDGIEFSVVGWGKVVGIGEPREVDESLSRLVGGAVDAVRYC